MSFKKSDMVETVQKKSGLTRKESQELVDHLMETMKSALESDGEILISGFGKFRVQEKKPRKGRNPSTGKTMVLDERRVVTFKCSAKLRDRLNEKNGK